MSKKITSRDVAKEAGVSQSLVSLILNNKSDKKIKPETRERVLAVAKELNYRVNVNARNMKSNRAGTIGLLSTWDTDSFVFPPVIKGVQSACVKNDMGVLICTGKKGPYGNHDFIDYFFQNRIDGLIYVSYVGVTREGIINDLLTKRIPFVCVIGARDIPGVSCVDTNFIDNGYIAVKHLAEQGYKKTAYMFSGCVEKMNYGEKERWEGCCKAAKKYSIDITLDDSFTNVLQGDFEKDRIKEAAKLLENRNFDSVVGCSYPCFIVLKAAAQMGLPVPRELGVISLDNELYAPYVYPSLTTVDEPLYDIASKATDIVIESINKDKVLKKLEIPPLLTVRESTGKNR